MGIITLIILLVVVLVVVVTLAQTRASSTQKVVSNQVVSRSGMKDAKYSGTMFTTSYSKKSNVDDKIHNSSYCFDTNDYLGKAADAKSEAKQAVKERDFDKAWGLFHEQKEYYVKHANRIGFIARDALSLDSTVHEDLANILRVGGKHHDAFFNILYWVIASRHRPIKRHEQKLKAYFNRCKFKNTTIEDVCDYIAGCGNTIVNPIKIREQVERWRSFE